MHGGQRDTQHECADNQQSQRTEDQECLEPRSDHPADRLPNAARRGLHPPQPVEGIVEIIEDRDGPKHQDGQADRSAERRIHADVVQDVADLRRQGRRHVLAQQLEQLLLGSLTPAENRSANPKPEISTSSSGKNEKAA